MKKEAECGYVPVGLYYNDVWEYDMNCTRVADMACSDRGWEVLNPGIIAGGCRILAGIEVSERSERALRKTSIVAMDPAKWLQT